MKIELPLPPSINHLYGHRRGGGLFKTAEAKAWVEECLWILKGKEKIKGERNAFLYIYFYFKDKRRDWDNGLKATSDLLQEAGIVKNDRQIKRAYIEVEIDKRNPRMEIRCGEI